MKKFVFAALAVLIAVGLFFFIDVEQTQQAELPEISVEGGQAPEFSATTGDVEVGSEQVTLNVPTVDLQSAEEEAAEEG
ncbi:hypothetical protein [Pontivivens insulae]|uniref:Uncharacterized protein n=1 Tax=Pontivivens insulae TaxID=1639689 RepID=A0A2R8AAW9_9RHOB|nr:hypothetical protein [Pontivivens insulae]RED13267.1 hypothetical protein DFR53_2403 [Pontivivens insulae]SPF29359.1 hypothetical protein POI8812_01667 [Pontivivens insulae]